MATTEIERRHVLGAKRRAFERRDAEIDAGTDARADFFANVEHRRGVRIAFADDDAPANGQLRQLLAHRLRRREVGGHFVAASPQSRGGDRGALGDARASSNVR